MDAALSSDDNDWDFSSILDGCPATRTLAVDIVVDDHGGENDGNFILVVSRWY